MTMKELNEKLEKEKEVSVFNELFDVLRKHYPWKAIDVKKVLDLAKYEEPNYLEMQERNDIAKILADNFMPEKFDDSDFEWCAFQLQQAGYHKGVSK